MFMQYFQSEMKLNRASYILSYFFSKGSLVFASNKSISYKIDSYINHAYSQADKMARKEKINTIRVRWGHSEGHWFLYQCLKL